MFFRKKKPPEPDLIYETKFGLGGAWIKVFPNRVEFWTGIGQRSIPINQIASVQMGELGLVGHVQLILETTGGKKYKIPCKKMREVKDAIYQAQEAFNRSENSNTNTSIADEITKLIQLKEQGVLSAQEFEEQKKKILSK